MNKILILFFFAPFLGSPARAQGIQEIRITSSRSGWGFVEKSTTVSRKNGRYFEGKRAIPAPLVIALEESLNAPVADRIELDHLGITQDWLDANAEAAMQEVAPTSAAVRGVWTAKEKELFLTTFKDRTKFGAALQRYYKGFWTDDYPAVKVTIKLADGKHVLLESKAQQAYMIPWSMEREGRKVRVYNPDIGRALAAMLPETFPNQKRISGVGLRRAIADDLMMDLREPLGLLHTEATIGKQLGPLYEKFKIITSDINTIMSIDVEPDIKHGQYTSWNAKLLRKGQSPQIQIGVSLPYINNQISSLDAFQKDITRYELITESVPWLKTYLISHPESRVEIRYVNGRSLSEKAMGTFLEDMKKLNKFDLGEKVRLYGLDVVFLEVESVPGEWSRWIILPDRRVILWVIAKNQALNWKATDFKTNDCYGQHCVGALISEQGVITEVKDQ